MSEVDEIVMTGNFTCENTISEFLPLSIVYTFNAVIVTLVLK